MHIFLILFISLYFTLPADASRTVVVQSPYYRSIHSPYYNNYYMQENRFRRPYNTSYVPSYYNNVCTSDLSALEKYALDKNYLTESNLARLERLERAAFGNIQQGDLDTRYENVRSAILSRPINNSSKFSLIKSAANYLGGQLTGFTPSINEINPNILYPSNAFTNLSPSAFGNTSFENYITPWGKGYRVNNYGTSSSSGIRILD